MTLMAQRLEMAIQGVMSPMTLLFFVVFVWLACGLVLSFDIFQIYVSSYRTTTVKIAKMLHKKLYFIGELDCVLEWRSA